MTQGRIHLGAGAGYTACGIFIPDLMAGDRYWYPPRDSIAAPPLAGAACASWDMARVRGVYRDDHPVTCEWCLEGKLAPICSTDPKALRMYIVYRNPRDYPGEFVARERFVHAGRDEPAAELAARGRTLDEVRRQLAALPRGRFITRLERDPQDDPAIVEVWL